MNIFSYGKIYSKLSPGQIKKIGIVKLDKDTAKFAKNYFGIFGYPDIASQRRYNIIKKLLMLKKGETVLDAGCGNGIYLQEFSKDFDTKGLGIDARRERIQKAKLINSFLKQKNIFKTSTLEKAKLGNTKFDKAICLEVLEHINDDSLVIKSLSKNLKKGGLFVISVPIIGTALTHEQEHDPNFVPEKYEHVRSGYRISDLRKMAKKAGLKVLLIDRYFFIVSRYMVKVQQFLYKRNFVALNVLLSPVLLVISQLDNFIRISPRGYVLVLQK